MKLSIQRSLVLAAIAFAVLIDVNLVRAAVTKYPDSATLLSDPPMAFPAHQLITIDENTTFPQLLADYGLGFPDPDRAITAGGVPEVDSWVIGRNPSDQPLTIQFATPTNVFGMNIYDMGDHATEADGVFTLTFEDDTTQIVRFEDPAPTQMETGIYSWRRFLGISSDDKAIKELTFDIDPATGTDGFLIYDLRIVPEPASLSLLALGGLAILRRRRQ